MLELNERAKKNSTNKKSDSKKQLGPKMCFELYISNKNTNSCIEKMNAFKESLVKMMRFCTIARATLLNVQWLRGKRSLFTFFRLT